MIDISCKFYLQKNDVTYTYCFKLSTYCIIRHQMLLLACRELSAVALSHHLKIRKLLTSALVFAVNRYEFIVENKNIRTFSDCKPSKKQH